jgi:DNA polymerase-3 subunit epsilon
MTHKGFAVIDFETTGFSPQHHHRVIEIGLVHVSPDGVVEREFETVLNPGRDLGPTHVHGLRGADVKHAPTFEAIADQLIEHLRGRVLVAHNARFETTFLRAELARLGITSPIDDADALCTMKLAKTHLPGAGTKLADCCSALGIPLEDAHEALADARATAILLGEYRRMGRQDAAWWRDHATRAAGAKWPKRRRVHHAEWVPRSRTAPVAHGTQATGPNFGTTPTDKPLSEQALDWLLPVARKRFGTRPVAIAESVARHLISTRSSESKTVLVNMQSFKTLPEPSSERAAASRGHGNTLRNPQLSRGDVVVLTGVMSESRDILEARLIEAGFVVEPLVTKRTTLLVAADLDSLSGKARKARAYGIPIVGESAVAALTRKR